MTLIIYIVISKNEDFKFTERIQQIKEDIDQLDSVNMRRGRGSNAGDYTAINKQLNQLSADIKNSKKKPCDN